MYKCKHFSIEELVPASLLNLLHEDVLWGMFDQELLKAADWVKETYSPNDPVTVNTWKWGGPFSQSGIRTKDSEFYRDGSAHSKGMALDMKFKNTTAEAIRSDIKARMERGELIPFIREIEDGVNWLHISTRPKRGIMKGHVYFFKP